ncbi:MAG TPA: uroporphyrinogen-III synthase [Blastocatellia bacterium]|nr:uroporphyrinogen-III synthase [Blastocatellia bacterium]
MKPGDRPLSGRTVLITRQASQAHQMISLLEAQGATVVCCPTIETVEPATWGPLDAAIENLEQYDWLVFTSANGVRFLKKRMADLGKSVPVSGARRPRCLAIGPATALELESAGLHPDLIATDSKAEGVLAALIEHLGGEQELSGKRFLLPQAAVARAVLPDGLRRLGAEVAAVEAYRTIKPGVNGPDIAKLFAEHRVDVLTFTSPSTVSNFAGIVGTSDLSLFLNGVVIACIGPITAAAARGHGLDVRIEPEAFTAARLVDAICQYFMD